MDIQITFNGLSDNQANLLPEQMKRLAEILGASSYEYKISGWENMKRDGISDDSSVIEKDEEQG